MLRVNHNSNFLNEGYDIYVCPVNCVGVMGAGVALHFSNRMSAVGRKAYIDACMSGLMKRKACILVDGSWKIGKGATIAMLATKNDWRRDSDVDLIKRGLVELRDLALNMADDLRWEFASISMPAIGCGRGNLSLDQVMPVIEEVFDEDPRILVTVHLVD